MNPYIAAVLLLLFSPFSLAADTVKVHAITKGRALVSVNNHGEQIMAPGSMLDNVVMHGVVGNAVDFSISGDRHRLAVGQMAVIEPAFSRPLHDPESSGVSIRKGKESKRVREISIQGNAYGSYLIRGSINGVSVLFQVDTGADVVSMSKSTAPKVHITAERGQVVKVKTASGVVDGYIGSCQEVTVGSIRLERVLCGVSANADDGMLNEVTLLGMSFLRRINMRQENGVLTLSQVY